MKTAMVVLQVRISPEDLKRLKEEARRQKRTMSDVARISILKAIDKCR